MKKWEILFDTFWDKLEWYTERYAPIFLVICMFYMSIVLIISYYGNQ